MIARVWTKPVTQAALKWLRANRYSVVKTPSGIYEARNVADDTLVFAAMPGNRGYLVRIDQEVWDLI